MKTLTARSPFGAGPVSDFTWQDGRFAPVGVSAARLERIGGLWGQFALHTRDDRADVLVRDRLGVNKLFFTVTAAGDVESSNYLADLLWRGHQLRDIWSVPAGHMVRIAPRTGEYKLVPHTVLAYDAPREAPLDALVDGIRRALTFTFERLAAALRGRRIFVNLSGGLDSTVVALLAREHFDAITAVTFAMDDEQSGSDLSFARLVAEHARIPLEVVRASPDDVVALLDTVLVYGQDWRDFNVHCGLVNAAIGRGLRARLGEDAGLQRPVLLTGDTMNELVADYSPVVYRNIEYYTLPKVPMDRLRRVLVAGLDAGDREVGIFNAFGFDVIQPYALAADALIAVPGAVLAAPRAKQELVRAVMGDRVPAAVYDRPKVRAQVGSTEGGGTLAVLADRGIDAIRLQQRFAELFGIDVRELQSLIRGGLYRFTPVAPWELARA